MKKIIPVLIGCAILMAGAASVEAKWWIFGKSADEVTLRYLYLNDVSFDEGGPALCLPTDRLAGGLVVIKGKAEAGKSKIGTVQVTTDKKQTWVKARLSKDGTFEYTFTPQTDLQYDIYVKVTDTRGKTNDSARTYKQLKVVVMDSQASMRDDLDAMIKAYSSANLGQFMKYVSEDFASDKSVLERAVMHDFSALRNIDLRYTVNNITKDTRGNMSVSITFTRTVTSARTGQLYSDNGMTEFVFKLEGSGYKVFSMKMPLIFGLSDAANVATGSVNSAASNIANIISVNTSGQVGMGAASNASGTGSSSTGSGTASAGTPAMLSYQNTGVVWWFQSLDLSNGLKTNEAWGTTIGMTGDFGIYGDNHHLVTGSGTSYLDLGSTTLSSITTVPASGYATATGNVAVSSGHVYIFKLTGNAYGAVQILYVNNPTTLMYKYSASGPTFK